MKANKVITFLLFLVLALVFLFPLYVSLLMSFKTAKQTFDNF
ncbi:hypothetical protein [Paenibacillus sp. oral taxon 786]|nr:hypothetical protein [Paenibacillus sp. oral taxon 786]